MEESGIDLEVLLNRLTIIADTLVKDIEKDRRPNRIIQTPGFLFPRESHSALYPENRDTSLEYFTKIRSGLLHAKLYGFIPHDYLSIFDKAPESIRRLVA